MYNYDKYCLDVLTSGLRHFEATQLHNLDSEAMDRIWDCVIRTNTNPKISRFLGRYFRSAKRIEIIPHMFNDNMLAMKNTILHELAHHITNVLYTDVKAHGKEWKTICRILGCEAKASCDLNNWNIQWSKCKNTGFYAQYLIKSPC